MATSFVAKCATLADATLIRCSEFRNGLQDHNVDFRRLNDNGSYSSYRNMAILGPATPEFLTLVCVQQVLLELVQLRSPGGERHC